MGFGDDELDVRQVPGDQRAQERRAGAVLAGGAVQAEDLGARRR